MGIFKGAYRPWYVIGDNGGQWDLNRQDAGLSQIDFNNKSVLEIGCAEGLVSLENLKRGARICHGIEFRERAVEVAKSIAGIQGKNDAVKFYQGDIREINSVLNQEGMLVKYDIVMAMSVLQKVANQPLIFIRLLEKCASTMVLRLPEKKLYKNRLLNRQWSWGSCDPVSVARQNGFKLAWESCGYPAGLPPFPVSGEAWMGVFERQG